MNNNIRIKQFSDSNIEAYETLTKFGGDDKLCYCSFWHAKWTSMAAYDQAKKERPEKLKSCVIDRMRSNFHVGVIAYINERPGAWISVGPLTDFYWAWRRVAQLGEIAKDTAGIMCFTIAPEFRGMGLQSKILEALKVYGKELGWTAIEAYPFADATIKKHGDALKWPGLVTGYERSGFKLIQDHWLSAPDAQRFIYKLPLT
jgi:GNAT superfamily N-acetyltransferase